MSQLSTSVELLRPAAVPYRIAALISWIFGAIAAVTFLQNVLANGIPPALADKDFVNYWMAARLAADGMVADVFGPQPLYYAHLVATMGPDLPWHNWSYPPHYLLMMMPLALVSYQAAIVLFLAITGVFFVTALNAFMGRRDNLALMAVSPFAVVNLWVAQNGFLTSGLILWFLALRERRPVLAGICLGALTIKPQLGVLLIILPLLERRWTVVLAATVTTIALVLASILAFGVMPWIGFFRDILPYQSHVMAHAGGAFLTMVPSVFGAVRLFGLDAQASLFIHGLVALPILIFAVVHISRRPGFRVPDMIVPVAIFVVVPYTLNYDLGVLGAVIALFIRQEEQAARPIAFWRQLILALGMLLPLLMFIVAKSGINIAPVALLAIFCMMAGRRITPAAR